MLIKSLINSLAVEIGVAPEEGLTLQNFWIFVGKNRVLEEKIDPIFGDLLSSAIPKARSRVKLLEPEFSDPAEPQTDAFKSWAWAQVMALPKIHLVRVVNPDPLQMIACPELKTAPYAEVEKYSSTLRITLDPSLREELVYGKATRLRPLYRRIVKSVAQSRDQGIPLPLLCKMFDTNAKAFHSVIKRLIDRGLLDRVPDRYDKCYTHRIFHTQFSHSNELHALCAKKAPVTMHDAAIQTLSAKGLAITFNRCLSKSALSKALEQCRGKFLTPADLSNLLGIPLFKSGLRRRFGRLVRDLSSKHHLTPCRAFDSATNKLQSGYKLLKPFSKVPTSGARESRVEVGSIECGVPLQHQIYSAVCAAGERGITSFDLRKQLFDMDGMIFNSLTATMRKPKDGSLPVLPFVWENRGKMRFHRYYTRDAFERLSLHGASPRGGGEGAKNPQPAPLVPNLTGVAREDALLALVRSQGVVLLNRKLARLLDEDAQSKYELDIKTLVRTAKKLVAAKRLCERTFQVESLGKNTTHLTLLADLALGIDHPRVIETIAKLREEANFKVHHPCHVIYTQPKIDWSVAYDSSAIPKGGAFIGQVLSADIDSLLPDAHQPPRPSRGSASDTGSECGDKRWLHRYDCQGLVRSRVLRVKYLHLALLKIVTDSSRSLHKQRTLATRDIFTHLPLQTFLNIIPVPGASEQFFEYTLVPGAMAQPLHALSKEYRRILFDVRNQVRSRMLLLLNQLAAMRLLVPLPRQCVDEDDVVHLPDEPCPAESTYLGHYYYLPEYFEPAHLLLEKEGQFQTYSVETPVAAAKMWRDLQNYTLGRKDILRPHYASHAFAVTMNGMAKPNFWFLFHNFTSDQCKVLDSHLENRAASDLAEDAVLRLRLALQLEAWPCMIRRYFLSFTPALGKLDPSHRLKKRRMALSAIAPAIKRRRLPLRENIPLGPCPLALGNNQRSRCRMPVLSDFDTKLMHMYTIIKFRSPNRYLIWTDVHRLLPEASPDLIRRRVVALLQYADGPSRAAELLTKWRAIYIHGITTGELQEKYFCPFTGKARVLTADNPSPIDASSYLPSFLPLSGFNLKEQFDYFIARSGRPFSAPHQARVTRLPPSVAELYAKRRVFFTKEGCKPGLLYFMPSNASIPLPASESTLHCGSELACFSENLLLNQSSSTKAPSPNLFLKMSLTSRFRNMGLDQPAHTLQPTDCTAEVIKVVIKMILLAAKTISSSRNATDFLAQFPPYAVSCAAVSLDNAGCITKQRIGANRALLSICDDLNITSSYSTNKYRPSDKFLSTLMGVTPLFMVHLARLSHNELLRLATPISPAVSPFIEGGGMMALLAKVSSFEIDLHPEYVPEEERLALIQSGTCIKPKDLAFQNDFDVHAHLPTTDRHASQVLSSSPTSMYTTHAPQQPADAVWLQDDTTAAKLFQLIDGQGPTGLPVIQMLEQLTQPQLYEAMDRLVCSRPPLIYRVGMDICRFVSMNHYKKWMVCVPSRCNPSGSAMRVPHPWMSLDGTDNERVLKNYINAALSHIVQSPGISLATLLLRLQPLVNREDLYFILEHLRESGCIFSRHFVQPAKAGPFSPRQSYSEVAPPRWRNIPHHPRGVTCYWPSPKCTQICDLSVISIPPKKRSKKASRSEPSPNSANTPPMIFSKRSVSSTFKG